MPKIDVYGARREAQVMQDTWGHLAAKRGRKYTGTVVFALGCFGDLAVVSADFDGLDDSPWFHEHLHEWIWDQKPEEGRIYRFTGFYRVRRNDVEFVGDLRTVDLPA